MVLTVKGKNGRKARFDQERFSRWLTRAYALPPAAAFKVARATRQSLVIDGVSVVDAATLPSRASTLMGRALCGAFPSPAPPQVSRGLGLPDPAQATTLEGAASTLVSIFRWLLDQLGDQGWEKDGPGSLKREIVGPIPPFDDQTAPDVRNFRVTAYECCKGAGQRGIEVTATVEVTDSGGVGNCSGVRSVEVCGVHVGPDGSWFLGPCREITLDTGAQERSEDEWESVTMKLCIDCAYAAGGVLPVVVHAKDNDDNGRMSLVTIPFGPDIRGKCCGG